MTLVVTINGPDTIWLLADRRLCSNGRPIKDDARKIMFLESDDGVAILGYAGLGATAVGTEPTDWMSSVLRGRNLSLEQSLGVLAEAMKKQLPRHLVQLHGDSGPVHNMFIPSFVGSESRLYTIDLVFAPDRQSYKFRYTRHVLKTPSGITKTPRFGLAGSGGLYLSRRQKMRVRNLLRVVRAHERKKASPHTVADYLAKLNNQVHRGISDRSVGPNCIVAWRHRRESVHKGGGGHRFYTSTTANTNSASLPIIAHGMDINAIVGVMMPHMMKSLEMIQPGEPPGALNTDELNAELALLPDEPDQNLR